MATSYFQKGSGVEYRRSNGEWVFAVISEIVDANGSFFYSLKYDTENYGSPRAMKKQGLHEDQLVAMQVSPRSLRHMQLPCDSLEEEALWHPQPMAPGRLRILDSWSDSCSSARPRSSPAGCHTSC
ncbi:unnamed protein product [Polarella glacialis]|uniref:Uncharacterized protein n=1 Tax=Polarella glacialis TaxID=89957 RepID=A0A813L3K4_POLGL|nr:unnamed protein product [Polarella glacialis]